jgi:hypothetical protein
MTREGTEVFYGVDAVMRTVLQFLYQTDDKIDACVDYTRPSLAIDIVILKKAFLDAKKRGVKLRYATEITQENRQSKSSIAMSKKSSSIKSMFLKPYGVKLFPQSSGYERLKKEPKLNFMKLSLTT